MSKFYTVRAIVHGEEKNIRRRFATRDAALNFVEKFYAKEGYYNFQVVDEYEKEKHNIEYVCDYFNRFNIKRVIVA